MTDPSAPTFIPPPPGSDERDFVTWATALPISRDLGLVCTALTEELGLFAVDSVPLRPNPNGSVHGGLVAAIADQCLGVVAVVNAPPEQLPVTASLHGQFHRPALAPLSVRARRLSAGRRLIFVECEIGDRRGNRCATFQATMAIGGAELRQTPEGR